MRSALSIATLLLVAVAVSGCQSPLPLTRADIAKLPPSSLPDAAEPMPSGMPQNDPPPGFVSFCMRFEDQCSATSSEPASIALNGQVWSELSAVNRSVNESIVPLDDQRHFDRAEYWTIPTDGYGNCHDYAVTKRKQLADLGLPMKALRIAIVVTPRNERHAVLTVATDRGDYVLDNLSDNIVAWNQTRYQWIARQGSQGDWSWVSLEPSSIQVATVAGPDASISK
jgi:predicted transglutaminase-like cysteine proteinase